MVNVALGALSEVPDARIAPLSSRKSTSNAALAYGDGRLAIVLALWFFVGCAVLGYLQRIVPFLWWIARSRREGTRNIPTLGEMNHSALGVAILALWLLAGTLLAIGHRHLAAAAALLAWVGLLAQLARPFLMQKRSTPISENGAA